MNFSRAADALGVTASAASMQIRALEQYLRVSLFRRNGRHVALTSEGAALLPRIRDGLEVLERALGTARAARTDGPLRLTMLASFLGQWLLPRLEGFTTTHPAIDLQIDTSSDFVDFVRTGVHAGVRLGTGEWPSLHVEKLIDDWLVPVCRPSLLKRLGPVHAASDLKRYRLLHSVWEPWASWLYEPNVAARWPASGMTFDDSVATIRAAEAGQALALARWSIAAKEVADGRLAIASTRAVRFSRAYYFVCPHALVQSESVAAFRQWLLEEAARFEAALPFASGPIS